MSFVFYDTETTGTHTAFDQILQFAAIRTDSELNELERIEVRCRLLPHIVPSPEAMQITRIKAKQLIDRSLPSHYEMVRLIREQLLLWSPAVFIGYNSIQFDEHLFRQALYKTLHPPYLTNTNGNSRSDAMRMVQAAFLFARKALKIPLGDRRTPIFKLDRVAPANGFNHDSAHDAMVDVEATIFLCRLLSDRAPDVWSSFMRFSQKAAVADYVSSEQIFCFSDFYFGKPFSCLATSIGNNPNNNSEFYIYDLAVDPNRLLNSSQTQLESRLSQAPKPVRRLRCNTSPMLSTAEDAPEIASARTLGMAELERRAQVLESDSVFRERLIATFESIKEIRQPSPHVEEQLYDAFFADVDQDLLDEFHHAPWEERISIVDKFDDERLKLIGQQLIHVERPDLLDKKLRRELDVALAKRILGSEGDVPWLTLSQALQDLEDLIGSADEGEAEFLNEHHAYISGRLERAKACL
jgi:exodeoxyribonuclease-1